MSSRINPNECPFCHTNDCPHLLLLVDKTFRTADGGPLMKAFNDRWYDICEENSNEEGDANEDFDEREYFEELVEEVQSLADITDVHDHEGGPGNSSEYQLFFCETPGKIKAAIIAFEPTE
jgi:hypothetical protein